MSVLLFLAASMAVQANTSPSNVAAPEPSESVVGCRFPKKPDENNPSDGLALLFEGGLIEGDVHPKLIDPASLLAGGSIKDIKMRGEAIILEGVGGGQRRLALMLIPDAQFQGFRATLGSGPDIRTARQGYCWHIGQGARKLFDDWERQVNTGGDFKL